MCAIVVKRSGTSVTEDELVAHSRTLITGYKRPRYVVLTDSLPRLPSSKISKVDLRKQLAGAVTPREIPG